MRNGARKQVAEKQAKHVGSFLFLMFIATFRPSAIWPEFTLSLEPLSVLAIVILLGYKIAVTIGPIRFVNKYRIELSLLIIYFFICFLSLYFNKHRYSDITEFIRYGVTFLVISATLPAAIFLFLLPQNQRGFSLSRSHYGNHLVWSVFLFLSILVIWQSFDFESSKVVSKYFIIAEAWPTNNIGGFLKVRTDAASVLAVALLSFVSITFARNREEFSIQKWVVLLFSCSMLLFAGLLTGGRVFILLLLSAGLIYWWQVTRQTKQKFTNSFLLFFAVAASCLCIPLVLPYQRVDQLSSFIPYMLPFRLGETLFLSDFLPDLSSLLESDRVLLWKQAFVVLDGNWLLGVSNGGYRLSHENVYQNSHTLLLQPLLAGGVFAFGTLLLLIMRIFLKNQFSFAGLLIIFSVFLSLQVDYQLDHSVPWNVAIAYIVVHTILNTRTKSISLKMELNNGSQKRESTATILTFVLFCICVIVSGSYFYQLTNKHKLTLNERLDSFITSRSKDYLTVVDTNTNYKINYSNKAYFEKFILVNLVDLSEYGACLYNYGKHRFIQLSDKLMPSIDKSEFLHRNQSISVHNSDQKLCDMNLYPKFDDMLNASWLSSNSHFTASGNTTDWSLWWNTKLSSALFYVEPGVYEFFYEAKGTKAYGQWPALRLSIKNSAEQLKNETTVQIKSVLQSQYSYEFEIDKAELVYLELHYFNDDRDLAKGEDRNLWLFPQTFRLEKNY